jgi:hypothetical protein
VKCATHGALLLACFFLSSSAYAQALDQGKPIKTSSYAVDLFQGPVLASTRPTGLSGAYAGIAEGSDGNAYNAASPAVRVPSSVDWFDWDATASVVFPATLRNTDFDNNGTRGFTYSSFWFATAGANLQLGPWGFGVAGDIQNYTLEGGVRADGSRPKLDTRLVRGHALGARSFFSGQLVIGLGARLASLDVSEVGNQEKNKFSTSGLSPEAGLILAPAGSPVRLGISGRTQVRSQVDATKLTPDQAQASLAMFLPQEVELPWEVEAGMAIQLGRRPFNVPWIDPKTYRAAVYDAVEQARARRPRSLRPPSTTREAQLREAEEQHKKQHARATRDWLKARDRSLSRQKALLSMSLLVSGPVRNAVGVESFLRQVVDRSGEHVSLTPRLGVEVEPVHDWFLFRFGNYLEPTRFRESAARVHFTTGFDVRTFSWGLFGILDRDARWKFSAAVDAARDYFGFGGTIGIWH